MQLIVLLCLFVYTAYTIETTILQYLTRSDQQTLTVAKQLFNIIESQKYFQTQPFTCLTLLPSNFTKNQLERVYKLNATYNYKHLDKKPQQQSATNIPQSNTQPQKQIVGVYQDYDYDKILDLLHGTCAIHQTNEFLYEYCHKQKVRQFDSLATYQRMGKQQYEDIAMGYFNYQQALKKSKSEHDKHLRPGNDMMKIKYEENGQLTVLNTLLQSLSQTGQIDIQALANTLKSTQIPSSQPPINTIPSRSVIFDTSNLFLASDINHKEFQLNKQTKAIHLNYPITRSNKYFTSAQYTHEVTCEYTVNGTKVVYIAKAVVIGFFELAFLGNVSKCDRVIDVGYRAVEEKRYDSPFYVDKFREVEDFLFGYVDQFCTNNWDWDVAGTKDPKDRNNYLEAGNTLWLELAANVSGTILYSYELVTVSKVIAPGVVKLEQNIRRALVTFKRNSAKTPEDSAWINSCRIVSKRPLLQNSLNTLNKILRPDLIQLKQLPNAQKKKAGDEMVCLCNFKKYNDDFLEMHLTLGNQVFEGSDGNNFNSYFEFYHKRTVKTVNGEGQQLHEICKAFICFDVKSQEENQDEKAVDNRQDSQAVNNDNSDKKFTQIYKLTSTNPTLTINFSPQSNILIFDISQKGLLKIYTQLQGQKYMYLISTSMLLKIRLFPNGSKQLIRENSFYQNQTTYNYVSWLGNSVFVHQRFVWRGYDKVVFPRMGMGEEKIVKIQRVAGYAYLRVWDLDKMKNRDSLYLSTIKKRIEEAFRVKKYPIYAKDAKLQPKIQPQAKAQQQPQQQQSPNSAQNAIYPQPVQQVQQNPDFTTYDFTTSHFKPLNKSVSIRYQYFHGDYCGSPHNRYRRTNVDLQCGEPWLKIEKVKQISPCIYQLQVSTRLLCRQDYHKTVDKVQTLNKNTESRVKLQKSTVCYPEDAWDNALYVYDVKSKEVYLSIH